MVSSQKLLKANMAVNLQSKETKSLFIVKASLKGFCIFPKFLDKLLRENLLLKNESFEIKFET